MADVSVNYQAVSDAARQLTQSRSRFNDTTQRVLTNITNLTNSDFKTSSASDEAKNAAQRFKTALDRATTTLDRFAQFLEQNVRAGYTNLDQNAAGRFRNIGPGR
jgi:hypothetical protein